MNNFFHLWRLRYQLKQALKKGDQSRAKQLLQRILKKSRKLSWWEKLFYEQLKQEQKYQELQQYLTQPQVSLVESVPSPAYLVADSRILQDLSQSLQLTQHDQYKRQVTGIDRDIFDHLERQLVDYLKQEISKESKNKIKEANEDLNTLKRGQDPTYSMAFSPHVYFMKYFLENVYSTYLAWLFIYEKGFLTPDMKILDIAAGPATSLFGLGSFLESLGKYQELPQTHFSYFSLEQQKHFQYRGLQFWRQYINTTEQPINAYFQFYTENLLTYHHYLKRLPNVFFDLVIISHCFSTEPDMRSSFAEAYDQIMSHCLKAEGFVLLIVQDKKLFNFFDCYLSEDIHQERQIILKFLEEFGLRLIDYKYLTSNPSRSPMSGKEFRLFAEQYLPEQSVMSPLLREYLEQKFDSHYTLDDYVILAKR